jgi:hypothetical protein
MDGDSLYYPDSTFKPIQYVVSPGNHIIKIEGHIDVGIEQRYQITNLAINICVEKDQTYNLDFRVISTKTGEEIDLLGHVPSRMQWHELAPTLKWVLEHNSGKKTGIKIGRGGSLVPPSSGKTIVDSGHVPDIVLLGYPGGLLAEY